jgi:hypothetical protein
MEQDRKLAPPLNSADARHLINLWSSRGFFRVRGLGGKIAVEEIVPCSSYTIRLRSQYEDRSVSAKTAPYTGGAVDDRGRPPALWDLSVSAPADFEERTEERPDRPRSQRSAWVRTSGTLRFQSFWRVEGGRGARSRPLEFPHGASERGNSLSSTNADFQAPSGHLETVGKQGVFALRTGLLLLPCSKKHSVELERRFFDIFGAR